MQHQSLAEFLECGWSDGVKIKLREMAAQDDVKYLVAWDNAGRCLLYTSDAADE